MEIHGTEARLSRREQRLFGCDEIVPLDQLDVLTASKTLEGRERRHADSAVAVHDVDSGYGYLSNLATSFDRWCLVRASRILVAHQCEMYLRDR